MSARWTNGGVSNGRSAPREHGKGRARQITQRQTRIMVRLAGHDPLAEGYWGHEITGKAKVYFEANAMSPQAMVAKFNKMDEERKAFAAWKKQSNTVV